MCEQCIARTNSWGEVLPGFALIRATADGSIMERGDWGLVQMNDPSFYWPSTPRPDPFYNFTDEQINALTPEQEKEMDFWHEEVEEFIDCLISNQVNISDYEGDILDVDGDLDLPGIHLTEFFRLLLAIQKVGGPVYEQLWDSERTKNECNFTTDRQTGAFAVFGFLYHFLGTYIQQNPQPTYRDYDEEGFENTSLIDQVNKGFGFSWADTHKFQLRAPVGQDYRSNILEYYLDLGNIEAVSTIHMIGDGEPSCDYIYSIVGGLGKEEVIDGTALGVATAIKAAYNKRYGGC